MRYATGRELFQVIDGAAEKYLRYGFREFVRSEYRGSAPARVVTVEIYDMSTPLGAFGQYSMLLSDERDPATMEPRAVHHGSGGFLGGSQLVFWRSKYLVQINLMDEDADDESALAALAQSALPPFAAVIAAVLPVDPTGHASAPAALPSQALVWGGVTYLADNVFGAQNSGPAWVGHYRAPNSARYRIALFAAGTEAEARARMASSRTPRAVGIPALGDDAFTAATEQGEVTFVRLASTVMALADALPPGSASLSHAERVATLRAALAPLSPPPTDLPAPAHHR